jgi:uracil-DNA glycosylase
MQITDKLREQIGPAWTKMLAPFIESEEMDKLFRYIKERGKVSRICPKSEDLWKALRLTPPDKVRVIVAGIAPYHTYTSNGKGKYKGDEYPVADGLALSCSKSYKEKGLQPSLEQVYNCLEMEYNNNMLDPGMIRDGDLTYLAQQGVLLYNVALTVEEGKACSHNDAWGKFNQYFWEEVVNKYMKGIPVILLGQQSWKSEQYIAPMLHYVFKCAHPASAAYKGDNWSDDGTFRKVDKILMENNGDTISWYQKVPF